MFQLFKQFNVLHFLGPCVWAPLHHRVFWILRSRLFFVSRYESKTGIHKLVCKFNSTKNIHFISGYFRRMPTAVSTWSPSSNLCIHIWKWCSIHQAFRCKTCQVKTNFIMNLSHESNTLFSGARIWNLKPNFKWRPSRRWPRCSSHWGRGWHESWSRQRVLRWRSRPGKNMLKKKIFFIIPVLLSVNQIN